MICYYFHLSICRLDFLVVVGLATSLAKNLTSQTRMVIIVVKTQQDTMPRESISLFRGVFFHELNLVEVKDMQVIWNQLSTTVSLSLVELIRYIDHCKAFCGLWKLIYQSGGRRWHTLSRLTKSSDKQKRERTIEGQCEKETIYISSPWCEELHWVVKRGERERNANRFGSDLNQFNHFQCNWSND